MMNKLVLTLTTILLTITSIDVNAIPAFARKMGMACSGCHTAWPSLNAFGRQYKEHGYRIGHLEAPNKIITKDLKWDENLPVSVLLAARPYDKKDSGVKKNRALHEVELMVAGPMGEKLSGFFEIEAEDEDTNARGFDTGVAVASLNYSHNEAANLQFSWGSNTWFDSYATYTNKRRMTRGASGVIDQAFGGADNAGKLKSPRQNISLYGRPISKLFYGVAISGDASDSEGKDGDSLTLRIAYDVMPSLTIGAMSISGTCIGKGVTTPASNCVVDRDYSRTGLDIQSEIGDFVITAVALSATDDNSTATAEVDNDAVYVQALYTFKDGARVTWAPLIRIDSYEKSGGAETIDELTVSVNYYVTENIRAMLEFWDRSGGTTTVDDDRVTLQITAAF